MDRSLILFKLVYLLALEDFRESPTQVISYCFSHHFLAGMYLFKTCMLYFYIFQYKKAFKEL